MNRLLNTSTPVRQFRDIRMNYLNNWRATLQARINWKTNGRTSNGLLSQLLKQLVRSLPLDQPLTGSRPAQLHSLKPGNQYRQTKNTMQHTGASSDESSRAFKGIENTGGKKKHGQWRRRLHVATHVPSIE
jgi:hypothetical protein